MANDTFLQAVRLAEQMFHEGPSIPTIEYYTKLIVAGIKLQEDASPRLGAVSGGTVGAQAAGRLY